MAGRVVICDVCKAGHIEYICDKCGKIITDKQPVQVLVNQQPPQYFCIECSKIFSVNGLAVY